MKRQLYHIEPIYKSFIWGGRALIDHFHIKTDMENIGTIYHVIAIPGQLDNTVRETGEPLSVFYEKNPQIFQCREKSFPVRMTTTANSGFQSYQLHPDDAYAEKHENQKGKVSGAVALKASDHVSEWLFGNKAKNLEDFKRMVENKDWKNPSRPLQLQEVYDCVNIPEVPVGAKAVEPVRENGLLIYHYYEKAGEYVAKRFIVKGKGNYSYQGFLFLTCVNGEGTIEDMPIGLGETILVPADFGEIHFDGDMDLIAISYIEDGKDE